MNKKVLIIGGGVVVLGAIGYLYFTNKKKQDALLSGGAGSTSQTPTTGVVSNQINNGIPPLSTGGINPLAVNSNLIDEQVKLDKAKEIVAKIDKLNKLPAIMRAVQAKVLNKEINKLGYSYSKGTLSKL